MRVRDRERRIGYNLHKGTKNLVRDRERFEIESFRDRESQLYLDKGVSMLYNVISTKNSMVSHRYVHILQKIHIDFLHFFS